MTTQLINSLSSSLARWGFFQRAYLFSDAAFRLFGPTDDDDGFVDSLNAAGQSSLFKHSSHFGCFGVQIAGVDVLW